MKKVQKGRVPLERAISKLGLASRTEARSMIEAGTVKVHGKVETSPLRPVNPDTAHIEIEGAKATKTETQIICLNKPKGVLTTKRDPEGRPTVYDLLPAEYRNFHAVGRLDMNTTGLLLFTNDTRVSNFLTDPDNEVKRTYIARVRGEVTHDDVEKMMDGLEDKGERLKADSVRILKSSSKESKLEIDLVQGKNREIRRLCLAIGHEIISLKRIRYGDYALGDLEVGKFKFEKWS